MSWYRKYRPTKISELDLVSVKAIFLKMLEQAYIPQVLLFAGPKGTGKTSSSRILAAILNDPANADLVDKVYFQKETKSKKNKFLEADSQNQDIAKIFTGKSYAVQEMDAASNRGIDEVRALKEQVYLPPTYGKMTVYILDEAHMLTTEAFNALLKLLEEPPPHAIFILATTELHKVPETIISRATVVNFTKASEEEIKNSLQRVITGEKIVAEETALELIVAYADGSFRDGVKYLEMATLSGKVTLETAEKAVGSSSTAKIESLLTALLKKDQEEVLKIIQDLRQVNFNEKFFYKKLFEYLHQDLLKAYKVSQGKAKYDQKITLFLLDKLLLANLNAYSPIAFLPLEIALLKMLGSASKKPSSPAPEKSSPQSVTKKISQEKNSTEQAKKKVLVEEKPTVDMDLVDEEHEDEDTFAMLTPLELSDENLSASWQKIISEVEQNNFSLAALLRSAKLLQVVSNNFKIGVYYSFHKERLEQRKFTEIIENCAEKVLGFKIKFIVNICTAPEKADIQEVTTNQNLTALAEEVLL